MTDQKPLATDGARITLRLTPAQKAAEQLLEDPSPAALVKGVEHLPTFTKPARQRCESIPADIRQRLLSNVWCGQCRHEVTIINFSGAIKGGDLLLAGKCVECHGDVARVIEGV